MVPNIDRIPMRALILKEKNRISIVKTIFKYHFLELLVLENINHIFMIRPKVIKKYT